MTEQGTDIIRYGDAAMYESQPILKEEGARVKPRVFLLNATADPLGKLAVDMRMYRGDPVYSQTEITDDERDCAWRELSKTRLNTPLEGVTVKFMIEGVTRSFTHQLVRQRVGAFYVQESLRFAVKRGVSGETAIPLSGLRW
jgi:thymidylate synthase ThyX